MLTQKRCGVGRDAEAGLEKFVVRLMDHGLARRHGRELWKPRAQGQREECDDFGKLGAPVSFTVETTVLPSFARQRDSKPGRVHRPRMTHFSAVMRWRVAAQMGQRRRADPTLDA